MEIVTFTIAYRDQIIGEFGIPVYWTFHFGQEDLIEMFQQSNPDLNVSLFSPIHLTKKANNSLVTEEHFILRHVPTGGYTLEDRNLPPLTYLNSKLIEKTPIPVKSGDVIALPLQDQGQLVSCFLQIKIEHVSAKAPPIKQLMICSKKGLKFAVTWEEEPSTKRHVAVDTEKIEPHVHNLPGSESKNLRPSSEIICPHCGSQHVIYCMKCKMFMCYDGIAQKLKCPTCKMTYGLKDQAGRDIDIKTL